MDEFWRISHSRSGFGPLLLDGGYEIAPGFREHAIGQR